MAEPDSLVSSTTREIRWLILAVTAATLIKLFIALTTGGTLDVAAFQDQLEKTRTFGAASYSLVGKWGNPVNFLPVTLHLARAAEFLAAQTKIHFAFWIRLPNILADVGSVWLVWKLIKQSPELKLRFSAVLLMALSPVSILISGFHGNIDALMIFFLLLSAYLIIRKRPTLLAGMVFGLALSIKVVPLLFAPAIFFYLAGLRLRLTFFGAAVIVFLVGVMPYGFQNPLGMYRSIEQAGLYANWGWTVLAEMWLPQPIGNGFHPSGLHGIIASVAKYVMMAVIIAVSFRMNRKRPVPPLFLQLGLVGFVFMSLTPRFGDQYLSWLVPWVVALGLAPTIAFYGAGALYLLNSYACPLPIADCIQNRRYLNVICWLLVLLIFLLYCVVNSKRAPDDPVAMDSS